MLVSTVLTVLFKTESPCWLFAAPCCWPKNYFTNTATTSTRLKFSSLQTHNAFSLTQVAEAYKKSQFIAQMHST